MADIKTQVKMLFELKNIKPCLYNIKWTCAECILSSTKHSDCGTAELRYQLLLKKYTEEELFEYLL